MQQVLIPSERLGLLMKDKADITLVEKICKCKIDIGTDGVISIKSANDDAYSEFIAKNIFFAFGRGFEMRIAEKLEHDDCYFELIDIARLGSEKRITQMKARVIGDKGRTKAYIESVSGAKLAVHGDTISFIGTATQINEAKTAVDTLLKGSTHKLAYMKMEAAHRKNKKQAQIAPF